MLFFCSHSIKSNCIVLRKFHILEVFIWKSLEIFFIVDFFNLPWDLKKNSKSP